jgi:hypothetical protein
MRDQTSDQSQFSGYNGPKGEISVTPESRGYGTCTLLLSMRRLTTMRRDLQDLFESMLA